MTKQELKQLKVGDVVRFQYSPYTESDSHILIVSDVNRYMHTVQLLFLISGAPAYNPGDIWGDLGYEASDMYYIDNLELIT